MASRPVFRPDPDKALVQETLVEFEWFPGFAVTQKQRSIRALHAAAAGQIGGESFLEVSTKSEDSCGVELSAFNLRVPVRGRAGSILLEAAFQGSKVFVRSGQLPELYDFESGKEIKRVVRELRNEKLSCFHFENHDWPLVPKTAFYDWLYIRGLQHFFLNHPERAPDLTRFAGFTDIEFNPKKSLNCQARSCALYVALAKSGELSQAHEPSEFLGLLKRHGYGMPGGQPGLL